MNLLLTLVRAFEPADAVGYASSLILLATIGHQIRRQWKSGTSEGVSTWLFVGQLVASIGFTVYSALIDNMIFVMTNGALACAAVTGLSIVLYHRRRESVAGSRKDRSNHVGAREDAERERSGA